MKNAAGVFVCIIFFLLFPCMASAKEDVAADKKAVVFLLDASGSMKTNDPLGYAADSIAQLIYSLPTDYETGFVAYNTDVCADIPLVDNMSRDRIMAAARDVKYENYSNAGAGLLRAVEILEYSPADKKSIVMLSDGEVLMQDEESTELSRRVYQEAEERAAREGITIHVAGLGEEMEDTGNSVFQAASATGGGIYYTPQALRLSEVMESVLTDRFGIKQMRASIIDADGEAEKVQVELPFLYADTVRVLLTSDAPIRNVKTNFKSEGARQITGERYSLIEISKPKDDKLEIGFAGTAGSQVRIMLIPEYRVIPKVKVTYEDREPSDGTALRYEREALIEYTFYDADNENIRLWTEEYFTHGKIGVRVGGAFEEMPIEGGKLTDRRDVKESLRGEVSFDCSALPVNVLAVSNVLLELEEAPLRPIPEPEPEPPYALYGILTASIAGILAVLIFRRPYKTQKAAVRFVQDGRPAPGKSSYVGKLNIYITRAPSGYDIAPLSYDLFRLPSGKVISFGEILESCGVREQFEGADRIYVSSGQGKSVILTNQSDCCIMKSGEILMKKRSYPLPEEAKVDIAFEDEVSELTFQYKVLKPSEMA